MTVQVDQKMPSITVVDSNNGRVSVEQLAGGRPAVLFFMRAHTCVVCVRHARALSAMAGELAAKQVVPVVVVPGSARQAEHVRRRVGSTVQVVSSDSASAHRDADLGRTLLMQHSGTFLLDGSGTVTYAKQAAMPTGSFDRAELTAAVGRL